MFSRLTSWLTSNPAQAGYQIVPAEVEAQDNTELFNMIPVDVLAMIASRLSKEDLVAFSLVNKKNYHVYEKYFDGTKAFNKLLPENLCHIALYLPRKDLIPFFLTNKHTLQAFEDFHGNAKQNQMRVLMPTNKNSVYQGADAEVNFRDVNHVLMAQYFLNIKLHDLEAHADEIMSQDSKRECLVFGVSTTLGIAIGLAIHAGAAALLDRVVLPACFKCCVTNSTAVDASCCCAGNILTAPDVVVCGRYYDPWGNVLLHTIKQCEYRCINITFAYIPIPLPASCSAGWGIGLAPRCSPCGDCLLGPNYYTKHSQLQNQIRNIDSSHKSVFMDVINLNTRLRERKIGGAMYRMFDAPPLLKMQDDIEKTSAHPADLVANDNYVPLRIAME